MSQPARSSAAAQLVASLRQHGGQRLPQRPPCAQNDGNGSAVTTLGARPASDERTSSSSARTIISISCWNVTLGFQPSALRALPASPRR